MKNIYLNLKYFKKEILKFINTEIATYIFIVSVRSFFFLYRLLFLYKYKHLVQLTENIRLIENVVQKERERESKCNYSSSLARIVQS